MASRKVTVEQVEQIVATAQTLHRTDDLLAQQLSEVKLTERLTGNALQRLLAMSPGPKSTQSLHAVADQSAFLDPPAADLPATPAPDIATQKAIAARMIDYVGHTLPTLPNLLATRVTENYVDTTRGIDDQPSEARGGLFLLGGTRAPVTVRDGLETDDRAVAVSLASLDSKGHAPGANTAAPQASAGGLTSWGEFGPILGVVLLDAAKGKLGWARWQQEDGKPVAVFQFSISREISQFEVKYCCESIGGAFDYASRTEQAGSRNPVIIRAGYHGRLEVDPVTGTVLRITIEADLRPEDPILRASMMVEYGAVTIGDSPRICPTRSVSISVAMAQFMGHGAIESVNRMRLNDVEFTDYHRFGSESRLIAETSPATNQPPPAQPPTETASVQPAASPATAQPGQGTALVPAATPSPASPEVADPSAAPVAVAASVGPTAAPTPESPAQPQPDAEIQVRPADSLPGMDTAAASPPSPNNGSQPAGKDASSFTLKVTTRLVDVGLIADDKRGQPVEDLKQDQVDLFDQGRKQLITAFHHAVPAPATASASAPAQPEPQPDTFTNAQPTGPQIPQVQDTLILLIDESHLPFQDLNQARAAVIRFLNASQAGSPVALYAFNEGNFRIIQDITRDHALLARKLAAWTPDIGSVAHSQELDRRNRQQFDEVHNVEDLASVNGNRIDAPMTVETTDPELRQMGNNPLHYSLEVMVALARHLAGVPGHKSLAWISGDSALVDWQDQAVGADKGSQHLEAALLYAREALNEADIALYAVDASAVEGGAIDASLKNQNIQLNQAAMDAASLGGQKSSSSQGNDVPVGRNASPGRLTAQMQQDVHAIQMPVRELTEATGGRAFNRGSDLKLALDAISRDSGGLYELGFNPDTPADGKFHVLQVKTPGRKNVVLRYRSGYLYSEETESTRQRFQQAVWSPRDATGISLTAEAVKASDSASTSPTINLGIAFPGLALQREQQGPIEGRWTDKLYIFVAQRDDAAQKAEISGDTLVLSLKQSTYDSGMPDGIPFRRPIEVKSRFGSIRVIVVDGNTGKMGSVTLPASAFTN